MTSRVAPIPPQAFVDAPAELPERPAGWTRQILLHMNFGQAGGAASFSIKNEAGQDMPIGYQYDTRKGGRTGFTLDGIDDTMSWAELRAVWPEWLAKQRACAT